MRVDAMLRLMQLTRSRLVRAGETAEQAQVWTGKEISGLLATVGIGPDKIPTMERAFRKLAEASYEAKDRHDRAPGGAEPPRPSISNPNLFEALFVVLRYMFRNNQANLTDYRVVLMESINYERKFSNHHSFDENPETTTTSPWFSKRASKPSYTESRELSLNFWCLNPSVVFSELASEARCLILVSGTLSPLDALEAELGVTFPIRLEAGHVITADRVIVTTLSHGPSGIRLCGTYQHQSTYTYQDELGQLILQACYIVPGGILCFLPSYALLDKLVQRWETTGLISQLRQVKHVMIEPRTSVGLDAWLKEFYSFVDKFDSAVMHRQPLSESNPKVTIDFDNLPGCYDKQLTGAIVFAVCRGKVSEGLDFADSYGRLVIAVGIPYPAFKNPLVQQKREFNDYCRRLLSCPKSPSNTCSQPITSLNGSFNDTTSARSSSTEVKRVRVLNGSEWYDAQAYRALNQALGRCIRHMNDWGAVLLVDARFVEQPSRYMSGISRWIRQRTTRHTHWSSVACSLKEFVDRHKTTAKIEQQTAELSDIFDE
ncbi:unnamed protein product [Dicrocoelium dendriticum]|nr:unnamed protein product [Dicrocoelium dendriticum]